MSTWVQEKLELFEGELVVFKRANSPNWYMRVYVPQERKHYQKSLKTTSQYEAIEKAKSRYKELQQQIAKDEKIFTITLADAVNGWFDKELKSERRGTIANSTFKRRTAYIKNIFAVHFGYERKVNTITDEEMIKFVDMRFRKLKNRSTMMQEISIIKQFYSQYLIKQGYVFRIPEIPEFAKRITGTSKREDTFNPAEYRKLYEYLRYWSNPKNISNIRNAEKNYGKKDSKIKELNEWEHQMEVHRRILIREIILILANTGIRAPSEILSLKWGDIEIKKEKLALYTDKNTGKPIEEDQLIAYIKIGAEHKTGARLVQGLAGRYFKRLNEYFRNELGHIPQKNEPVFMEFYGRRKFNSLDRYALYRMWGELMRDCNLNRLDFQPYHLRHWYITQSILNGVDMLLIAKNCGNSVNTIAKHYEHVDLKTQTKNLIKRRDISSEIANTVEL